MAPHQIPTRKLGKNGPQVAALGFGCMGLSSFYGKPRPDEERLKFLDHVYAAGETHWDSADVYGDSEDLLGKYVVSYSSPALELAARLMSCPHRSYAVMTICPRQPC